jgi:hypothetical protein
LFKYGRNDFGRLGESREIEKKIEIYKNTLSGHIPCVNDEELEPRGEGFFPLRETL